ncbi:MAG: hypothetical protein P8Z75_12080 [Gammaproteobacteria bacterium]
MAFCRWILLFALFTGIGVTVSAVAANAGKPLNKHEVAWHHFADQILSLHRKLISQVPVVKKTRVGGYARQPAFYREVSYYSARTHKLISRIRWEKQHPDKLHTIEVFIRDDQGRVTRDFTAAYLPNYYRAPSQTLISFHGYHDGLQAFRTFDADGYRVVEGCRGEYQGKKVEIILDEDEIAEGAPAMHSAIYKTCFRGMRRKVGKYLTPQ